ncbi:unnamed protein product [marine sediment metagenome]|uniref:Uncharacterized protein n=1 Tax=marine sediment metagenome TaxID=412755 RepID=X1BU63_9ZZZZ
MTGITKTHRGETTVGLTVVKDAPYYSTILQKLFDSKEKGVEAERVEQERRAEATLAKKLKTLQRIGVGGKSRTQGRWNTTKRGK